MKNFSRQLENERNAERALMQHYRELAQRPTQFISADGPDDAVFEKAIEHVRRAGESRSQFVSRTGLGPTQAKQMTPEQITQFVQNAAAASEHVVEPRAQIVQ